LDEPQPDDPVPMQGIKLSTHAEQVDEAHPPPWSFADLIGVMVTPSPNLDLM